MPSETASKNPVENKAVADIKEFKQVKEFRPPNVQVASKKEVKTFFDGWLKKEDKENRLRMSRSKK